jgi:DNA-binding CsgD family transcriptional regulator
MDQPLTQTQLELVVHLANGLRVAEIAAATHRSESSVSKTLSTAQRRAGARTLPHLVSIVIAAGVLEWTPDGERALQEACPSL